MKQVPVSDFIPHLRKLVPVDIPLVAKEALINAAIRFCRDTRILVSVRDLDYVFDRQIVKAVSKLAESRNTDGGIKACDIISVTSNGESLESATDYHLVSLDELRFLSDYRNVMITSIVEPTLDTKFLPEQLFTDWLHAICHGAAALICSCPGAPKDVAKLSLYHETNFVEAINHAKRWRMESALVETIPNRRNRKREFF
ncbi:hypothetical protein [Vibrio sp. 11986-1-5]|uniref:hypothetical protein n=1 Tax=Vibrio sp. 11986-1-5 TaxID=2211215 RepID=UPI000D73B7AF|nr:hypothetical protein [Vibrio sp. 11986-1-5]PXA72881.1 hypothetical protein DMC15_06975 [Vibrio sp. 11986-1-5]